jgi:hypothetical protein
VRFSRADELLRLLRQSRLDNCREALMLGLSVVDLLIIDDFALEPMTRDESRDFYQLLVERTARAATIITSNRDTADWLALFDDPLLGQSAVDRLPCTSPFRRVVSPLGVGLEALTLARRAWGATSARAGAARGAPTPLAPPFSRLGFAIWGRLGASRNRSSLLLVGPILAPRGTSGAELCFLP